MKNSVQGYLNRQYLCVLRRCAWNNAFSYFIGAAVAVSGSTAFADSIVPDGRTQTQLSVNGAVTDVTTQTVRGANAINSFHRFNIGNGQTVNLYLPTGTANLLNLVHDERSQLDGVMNAYKDGRIGGNVFFLNPHGIVVGAGGVLNVGSLTMATPTSHFMDSLIDPSGLINDGNVNNVLTGYIPLTDTGLIQVKGRINAANSVNLMAGQVAVDAGAHVVAGPQVLANFADLVNIQDIVVGSAVEVTNGVVRITAAGNVDISGEVSTDGTAGNNAGTVDIHAGADINLTDGAHVSASGQGVVSSGGNVTIYAQGNATLEAGARVAANGGISGDGGFVEFSAMNTVNILGGNLEAGSRSGVAGTILIDPTDVSWTGTDFFKSGITNDFYTGGANIIIDASNSIHLTDVTISTRNVDTLKNNRNDIATATSMGNSGNITLTAPNIILDSNSTTKSGTKLLANSTPGFIAGDITLIAEQIVEGTEATKAYTKIDIDGATLMGRNISLTATSDATYAFNGSSAEETKKIFDDKVLDKVGLLQNLSGVEVKVAISDAKSEILIKNGTVIDAQGEGTKLGQVELVADTSSKAEELKDLFSLGFVIEELVDLARQDKLAAGFLWGQADATANVDVASGAKIKAGTLNVSASNKATTDLSVLGVSDDKTVNAAAVVNMSTVQSTANIAAGAIIDVTDSVTVLAHNENSFSASATSMALGKGQVGVAVNYTDLVTGATASNGANLSTKNVTIKALDDTIRNKSTASTQAGTSLFSKPILLALQAIKKVSLSKAVDKLMGKLSDQSKELDSTAGGGKPKVAAAVTYASNIHNADAFIGEDAEVIATGDVIVSANVRDQRIHTIATAAVEGKADDPNNPGASLGLAGALTIGRFEHNVNAYIGDKADISASRVGVVSNLSIPYGGDVFTEEWDSLGNVIGNLSSLNPSNWLSGWANATVDGCVGTCLAGSVNDIDQVNTSDAYIGRGAKVTSKSEDSAAWGGDQLGVNIFSSPLHVAALSDVQGVYAGGNMSVFLNGASGTSGASALGGGYNQVNFATDTRAWVSEGAVIDASKVEIQADASTQITAVTPSAGRGASYGASMILSRVTVNDTTEASIDDEAQVKGTSVDVQAKNSENLWALTGALNAGESAGVGLSVAINDVTTDTQAKIADNDANNVGGSTLTKTDGKVSANDVAVTAVTDGSIEAIAVAAASASSDDTTRPRSNATDKQKKADSYLTKAGNALTSLVGKIPVLGSLVPKAATGNTSATQAEPKFGIAASGSSAVNLVNLGTHAYLDGATIEHPLTSTSSLTVSAVNNTDITAATGSAALTRANNSSSKYSAGVAGSVAVNMLENTTEAYVKNSTDKNAQDVSVTALAGGEQLAIAIGLAVNTSSDQNNAKTFAGSVSVSQTNNTVSARLEDSTFTGQTVAGGREINVTAYDRMKLGTGGGSLVAGGKGGVGAAVTYSEISNTTEAIVSGATVTNYDDVAVHALTATKIAAGGAMAGGTWADDGTTLGGAFVISDIGNTVNAEIRNGSAIAAASKVDLLAADTTGIKTLDDVIDANDGGRPNSSSLDYDGTSIGQTASAGSSIISVAGVVQVGKSNVGASFVYNKLHNNFTAAIRDSNVSADNTGAVNVVAESNAKMLGIGFGVGVATDKAAGSGSLALSEIENVIAAEVTGVTTNKVTAGALTVKAEDKSRTDSFAGNISASFGDGAVGASVAVNNTTNKATAKIVNVDIDVQQSTQVTATNDSQIRALAATAGFAKGGALNGAAVASEISNTTEAYLLNAKSDDTTNSIGLIAQDHSKIDSLAGAAAFSGSNGGGAGVVVNQIGNTTDAYVAGGNYAIKDMDVFANSNNVIRGLAVGVGAGTGNGIGGSVSVNLLDNDVTSSVKDGAVVVAENNVGIAAQSDDRIAVAAGSLGIGLGGAGIGVSFTVNSITGNTKAFIDGATTSVTGLAKGSTALMKLNSGALDAGVKLAEQLDLVNNKGIVLKDHRLSETATGVAVNASSTQQVENISANVAGGSDLAVGLVESINDIGGSTQAYVLNAKINDKNTDAGSAQAVAIKASNVAYANSFIGGVSAGGAAGGAGMDLHTISRTTRAYVAGGSIDAKGAVSVDALSMQGVSSIAVGGAVGGQAGAGTLSLVQFNNLTDAFVDATRVAASSLTIKADNSNNMYVLSGAVAVGGNAGGGAFAVGSSNSTTTATLKNAKGANRVDVSGDVSVDAKNATDIHHIVVSGAGGGGNGIAGMADVNLVTDRTEARIENSDVGATTDKVGAVHVRASHTLAVDSKAGAIGIGLSGGGVGAGASVNIIKAKTTASVDGSSIYSTGKTEVVATSGKQVDAFALTLGVGGTVGIGGAAVVTLVGDDVGGESAKELNKGGTGTLDGVNKFTSGDKFADLPGAFGSGILSADDKAALNASNSKSTTAATGSAGGFEFRTAAELTGTNTVTAESLDVTATDKTATTTGVGGFGISLGGAVGGAVAVTSVKANVAAKVSGGTSTTTTGAVNVKATADNNVGKAIDVKAVAGGAGSVGLGAAVSYTDITNHVDASLAGVVKAGAVTVAAQDNTAISSYGLGAAVGAAAAGIVVSHAAKTSTINASAGGDITASSVSITAKDGGQVKAVGQSAAGGLSGAGAGALVEASDDSTVQASTTDDAKFTVVGGALNVHATGTPQTEAEADGVAVSGGLSIGASSATATSSAVIRATLGARNTVTAGQLDVHALRAMGAAPSSLAKAFGASGGLLLGANATNAKAESGGETSARVGDDSTLNVSGATTVSADSTSMQTASGLGFSGGIVAAGADFAEAKSNTLTQADLGNGVKVTGNSLQLLAASDDTNYAYAVAGSGGLLSAPFSLATTSNLSETHVSTGSGNNTDGDERKIDVGSFNASATHRANFNSWMSSTNGSLLGASGAQAFNDVKANTTTTIGAHGYVEADNIQIDAHNTVLKTALLFPGQLPGSFDITSLAWTNVAMPEWNVNSNSGGLADAPAAGSKTTIGTNALVAVGASAHLEQTAAGSYTLDAGNDVTAIDKVKMASGGLVSAASGRSEILADENNATVRVMKDAHLSSAGDMEMGASSQAKVKAQTSVDVYGLVGVAPEGDSEAVFKAVNSVDIGQDATLESLKDILIFAGADSQGVANSLDVSARSDVFNNTVIPANKDPKADATIDTKSQINVAAGANVGAVANVMLAASKGSATASGVGIGKDIYRETLADVANAFGSLVGADEVSFETRTGTSTKIQTSEVALNGEVHVGTHRKQELVIGMNGSVLSATDGISIQDTTTRAVAADILLRIKVLKDLIIKYSVANADADASIAVAGYTAEVKFLEAKLEAMRQANIDPADYKPGFYDAATVSPREIATQAITGMAQTVATYQQINQELTDANTLLAADISRLTNENKGYQADIDKLAANDPKIPPLQANIDANIATMAPLTAEKLGNEGTIGENKVKIGDLEAQSGILQDNLLITDSNNPNFISSATNEGPAAVFVTVSDAKAELGNIFIEADKLHGGGTIDAPGDAEIRITNTGPTFVVVNKLEIPSEAGGKLYFNGIDVKGNDQINAVNGKGDDAKFKVFTAESQFDIAGNAVTPVLPQIVIESMFDAGDVGDQARAKAAGMLVVAPDIVLQGDISNSRGLVKVVSKTGSIRVAETSKIRADTVEIKASNGDFIQSYSKGFTHVGRAPLEIVAAQLMPNGDPLPFPLNVDTIVRHDNDAGKGIIANGSVLITGQYLNINGTVQSGISEWGVSVAADSTVVVNSVAGKSFEEADAYYKTLVDAKTDKPEDAFFTVKGATVAGLTASEQGEREPITVSYNAKEKRLELSNVQIQGGYIGLSGQIFNTNSIAPDQPGGGQLKVMDGYGRIEVNNQTDLALWVNSMDTGRGVKGEISITNSMIDSDGVKGTRETVYTLDSVGGNRKGTFFTPDAGLEYKKMVGFDSGKIDYYRYSQKGWFDAVFTSTANDKYKIGTTSTSNKKIDAAEAESLTLNTTVATLQHPYGPAVYITTAGSEEVVPGPGVQKEVTSKDEAVLGASGIDCNWWTLCAQATHWQEYTIASVEKTTVTDRVKADYPIGIEFIGFDSGKVDIVSKGNVVINGSIYNRNGDTNVSSVNAISQTVGAAGAVKVMAGNNINLSAGTGIGETAQALTLNVKEGGKLNATTTTGDVHVAQLVGDLKVGTIGGAGAATVVVEAERNLLGWDAASVIQGNRVELLARNGGIGELSDAVNTPLTVRTAYTTDQTQWHSKGLMATARDNINVKNVGDVANAAQYTGDLLLISAESRTGDVRIETSGGVIDNNPYATLDTRTQKELVALWDSLALQGDKAIEKANEAVAAYKAGKENNYKLYWQMRQSQADGGAVYDPEYKYVLSQAERDVLVDSGMSSENIDQYAQGKRDLYLELNAEVGNFTTAFDSGYQYDVAGDEAKIRMGSSWSDTQLKLSVGAGLLKNITDTVTTIKEPNAKGKNVTLLAGTDIGSFNPSLDIDWDELKALAALKDLSEADQATLDASKAALAAAERGDATIVSDNVIRVLQPRPVNVTIGTGVLDATATNGFALIGSEQDLRLNTVAATGDIRLKTAGSVLNAASDVTTVNVIGANIILEAATGTVGSSAAPLRIAPFGSSGVTARAANGIWIDAMQDFYVDTMYSPSNIFLTSVGSIFDFHATETAWTPANNMLADFITLTALGGSIGTLANPLEVGVTGRGFVTATARTLGQGVYLNGAAGENFSIGPVLSGDVISLTSVDNVLLAGGTIKAPGAITVAAGTDGTGSVGIAAAPAGVIVVDTPSTLNVSAASNITVAGQFTSVGKATLTAGDNLVFAGGSVTGQQDLSLTAGSDGSGNIVGSVTAGTDVVAFGNLLMQAPDAVGAVAPVVAKVTNTATLLSSAIYADISTNPLSNPLSLVVSDIGGGPAANVVMNVASSKQVNFNTFNVGTAQINANTPSLQVPNGNITDYAVFNMPAYSMRIDTLNRVANPGFDVNGFTLSGAFNLSALINSVSSDTFTLIKNPYLQVTGNFAGNVEDSVQNLWQLQQFGVGYDPLKFNIGNFGLDVPSIVKDGSLVDVNVDWLEISQLAPNAEDDKEKEI